VRKDRNYFQACSFFQQPGHYDSLQDFGQHAQETNGAVVARKSAVLSRFVDEDGDGVLPAGREVLEQQACINKHGEVDERFPGESSEQWGRDSIFTWSFMWPEGEDEGAKFLGGGDPQ